MKLPQELLWCSITKDDAKNSGMCGTFEHGQQYVTHTPLWDRKQSLIKDLCSVGFHYSNLHRQFMLPLYCFMSPTGRSHYIHARDTLAIKQWQITESFHFLISVLFVGTPGTPASQASCQWTQRERVSSSWHTVSWPCSSPCQRCPGY